MASESNPQVTRITATCPPDAREILIAAQQHDVPALKKLLDVPGKASCQDPKTGETPLHAAIRGAGASSSEAAQATVRELFLSGAIWNDVDDHDETPGCLALRLGYRELYTLCVDAGVRAELLFALLESGYEELESGSEEEDEEEVEGDARNREEMSEVTAAEAVGVEADVTGVQQEQSFVAPKPSSEEEVKSEKYLRSKLTYSDGKLVDDDGNGVMMAWETQIMRQSVDALLPGLELGKRILNVGFGMGIIDQMFADTKPSSHQVIEAHPEVIARIRGSDLAKSDSFKVHEGKWQDICPKLLEEGETYDAIYFDTFGEDYSQLRLFFTEYITGLLDQDGIFGFFNGLGADRRICYDVYTRVVEIHLADAGLDVEWQEVDVDMKGLHEAGKGEWEGVKRRYWTLEKYRLPVCSFLG